MRFLIITMLLIGIPAIACNTAPVATPIPSNSGSNQGNINIAPPSSGLSGSVHIPSGSSSRRRIVILPVDANNRPYSNVSYTPQANDCVIYVRVEEDTIGINIYNEIMDSNNDIANDEIGHFLASDGVIIGERLMWGPSHLYRWVLVTVQGATGWIHADPPWTAAAPDCSAENYDATLDKQHR